MKLPVNRRKKIKKDTFLINRAAIPSGGEMLVLQLFDGCLRLRCVSVAGAHGSPGHR